MTGSDREELVQRDGHISGWDERKKQSRSWSNEVRPSAHRLLWRLQRSQAETWKGAYKLLCREFFTPPSEGLCFPTFVQRCSVLSPPNYGASSAIWDHALSPAGRHR